MKKILIGLINVYQKIPGPFHGYCKHIPTCSEYTKEAIKEHGSIRRITVEDLLNIKDTRANEILSILVKKGMISKEGGSKNIKYVLK